MKRQNKPARRLICKKEQQFKLEELQRAKDNAAFAKARSPPKHGEAEPTLSTSNLSTIATTTTTIAKANLQKEKEKASTIKENGKGEKQTKSSEEEPDVVALPSDEESDSELVIDSSAEGTVEQSAGTGPAVQSISAITSATPMETEARENGEKEPEEELGGGGETAMETSVPTQDELSMAVAGSPTPTPDHTYPTVVRSSTPTPAPIYSITSTTSSVPSTLVHISDVMTAILRYALNQGPHPATLTQQAALLQTTMSVQVPISSPVLSPTPSFNTHLNLADVELLKRKLEECKGKRENALDSVW